MTPLEELLRQRTRQGLLEAARRLALELGAQQARLVLYPEPSEDDLAGRAATVLRALSEGGRTALPCLSGGRLVGVLEAQGEGLEGRLEPLARALGTAAELVLQLEDAAVVRDRFGELLGRAAGCADADGPEHAERVSRRVEALGAALDLSEQALRRLRQAARLHDVGKLVLAGRAPWEIERFHPRAGADFLRQARVDPEVCELVEQHHEAWDGTGFPAGTGGEDLGLEAGVLALAEDLEAWGPRGPWQGWMAQFYAERGESHHPLAMEALSGLIDGGVL
ncbi:MAG: HD domain-containing phosphohydrolase [Candidatus Eremiobacterota bacterium]